ncbi:Formate dehydrogenase H [Chryseobacterium gleum]|uniref:Formate dehydrogenase H n=2 Tax=Chryseobacterium gleum TaxID=250 RepID=A0A448B8T9_CHRGE|nr:FdhF/YdeP family oxidoreductase [Chryseobacterium gleum]EFK36179.1 oxidoreductase alpha (molybdopterin) subunit [Chryseobacterium gleum ATCC 35910]QQY31873.1 FdhF/YdeP family oxidoreductase [Chryseobacterium gleum]VEE10975.1 Formate dehydrogenase H [Chryseobacterium gleum]
MENKDVFNKKGSSRLPSAEPPYKLQDLKLKPPKAWAAGVPAVIHSLDQLVLNASVLRGGRALFSMNQFDGFDCPSCAWPDPDDERSRLGEYCENGAKALAEEATSKKIGTEFFRKNSVYDLAKLTDFEISQLGRLAEPMYLPKGGTHYQPISWDDAFKKIAEKLNALDSPDEAIFYTSGRTSNEATWVYQLFAREFGTNNFPDCSNMCHETSGYALSRSIGIGKGTVKLEDFYDADLIMIIGQNPGTNSPRMLSALTKGKKNGAKIIAVNPLPEAGLKGFRNPQEIRALLNKPYELSDLYLPVKINGDMALLKALQILVLEEEAKSPGKVIDHDFITNKTAGFNELVEELKRYDLNFLSEECGIPVENLREAAQMIASRKRIIICWGMGITQQHNGVEMIYNIVNILLMKGSIGIKGGGACPVRGHSNVQGNRTLLINHHPTTEQLDKLEEYYGFKVPRKGGYDVVNALKAMHEGKVKFMFCMGGNFLSAAPDTTFTAEAMRKLEMSVIVSVKLNRGHLIHGKEALILPVISRSEKDIVNGELQHVSTENSMGVVEWSRGVLDPISKHLINETHVACRMAKAVLGERSVVDWDKFINSYDAVRNDIEQCIPGFENYNERVVQKGGFYLPNGPRDGKFNSEFYPGKAAFNITAVPDNSLAEDEYLMGTTRTHDQFNTVVYGLNDRYRGIFNERRVVMMNEKDIEKAGLKEGDHVDLFNYDDGIERIAPLFIVVKYPIPQKSTMTYFPETNVLVSINNVVNGANMPASKYVRIKIRKHDPAVFRKIDDHVVAASGTSLEQP